MRAALLTDIHANREAFEAVLDAVRDLAVDQTILLGDLVGYGPDPVPIVEKAAELVEQGAICILGNHDEGVFTGGRGMNENARAAIVWTSDQLSPAHLDFLAKLPLSARHEDRLYVHASADSPERWHYVDGKDAAARCLAASDANSIFCGHTHVPAIFYALPGKPPVHFRPYANKPAPLSALRRHVVVVGSVGQPRDGNPAACFGLLDTDDRSVTMIRVPYDCDRTARKIADRGLPGWLGMRLKIGR